MTLFTLMPLVAPDYDGGAPQLPKCKLLFATWNNYPATLQCVPRGPGRGVLWAACARLAARIR